MQYLKSFYLPSQRTEEGFYTSFPPQLEMQCYSGSVYPFKLFPQKGLTKLEFAPLTILYGGNGSGKSTLLHLLAEKLSLLRGTPYQQSPCMGAYLERCDVLPERGALPAESRIVTSDDVFDFLLGSRAVNEDIAAKRDALFAEYDAAHARDAEHFQMRSLAQYDELCRRNELRKRTKSDFTARRLPKELEAKSNGESAFGYFTELIRDHALYLLDEPENSLSAKLQEALAAYLADSVRHFACQLVIATHSPFLLAMEGARIYDLDDTPVRVKPWTALENMQRYHALFSAHDNAFSGEQSN